MHDISDPILSEEELAKWLDTSRPTLQRQRSDGSGPSFVQLSDRRIGYRKSAVERWLEARTINRVGALVSAKQAPEPAAQANITAPATIDGAKAAAQMEPASSTRTRGNGE